MLRLLRDRDFALLWSALTISLIGDGIYLVAVAWQVYDLSNMPSALAVVGLAWSIGLALFLLGGGLVSDRYDRRRVMIAADLVRALALGVIGVLAVTGALELWHLIALVVLYAAGEAFFGPALGAFVPDIVPANRVIDANALEQFVRQTCRRLIGPAVGGVTVAVLGAGVAFLLDASSFLISAVLIGLIAAPKRAKEFAQAASTLRQELREGIAYVRSQRFLWVTLIVSAVATLMFFGPIEVLLPYIVRNDLHGGAGGFGLVLAADAVGAIIASAAMSRRGRLPRHYLTVMFVSWSLATLPIAGFALSTSEWQLMVLSALNGGLMAVGLVIWGTLMQTRVPAAMRGRVTSVEWFVSVGFVPLSFALTGPVSATLGVDTTLIIAGLAPAISTMLMFFAFRLRREETPLPDVQEDAEPIRFPGGVADDLEALPEALGG